MNLDVKQFICEIEAFRLRRPGGIRFALTIETAVAIVAEIQLALRHPDNHGHSADIAFDFARTLQAQLEPAGPMVRAVLEAGWDAKQDQPAHFDLASHRPMSIDEDDEVDELELHEDDE